MSDYCMMSNYCKEQCDHKCDADNLVFILNGKIVYCMGCMHRLVEHELQ